MLPVAGPAGGPEYPELVFDVVRHESNLGCFDDLFRESIVTQDFFPLVTGGASAFSQKIPVVEDFFAGPTVGPKNIPTVRV
jgi:hypothetical protein